MLELVVVYCVCHSIEFTALSTVYSRQVKWMRQCGALSRSDRGSCEMRCDCVGWVLLHITNQLHCAFSSYTGAHLQIMTLYTNGQYIMYSRLIDTGRVLVIPYGTVRDHIWYFTGFGSELE